MVQEQEAERKPYMPQDLEIERKFRIKKIPAHLTQYKCRMIEQGYLSAAPTVRVRRDNAHFYLTYKNGGGMAHTEYNLPLTEASYAHLLTKADGMVIRKKRYEIPDKDGLIIELDIFSGDLEGLAFAEVEFESEEQAHSYAPPAWFAEDVTALPQFKNTYLSALAPEEAEKLAKKEKGRLDSWAKE